MKRIIFRSIGMLMTVGIFLSFGNPIAAVAQKSKKKQVKKVSIVKQYKKLPNRGTQLTVLPPKAKLIRHGRLDYHFYNGVFYRPLGGKFVVVAPPLGIQVSLLSLNPYRFYHLGHSYFYYYGTFYIPLSNGNYKVVAPPIGARVDALPDGYQVFEIDGKVYYKLDNIYYKAVVEENGAVLYEVVKKNS